MPSKTNKRSRNYLLLFLIMIVHGFLTTALITSLFVHIMRPDLVRFSDFICIFLIEVIFIYISLFKIANFNGEVFNEE